MNGHSSIGIISASQNYSAIFQAPAQIPAQNPVAVTVQPDYIGFSKRYAQIKLVSNISIYDDAYEVKMESVIKSGGKGEWGGVKTVRDNGSFIVSLEKNYVSVQLKCKTSPLSISGTSMDGHLASGGSSKCGNKYLL